MKKRIIVIEDEPSILDNILYSLESDGFEVCACTTGGEGLEQFRKNGADLIVLDVGLPDTSGFELCPLLRQDSDVPVIFLTARAEEVDRIVGLEMGADDYMVKPFSPRELSARVRAVLRRYRPACEEDLEAPSSTQEKRGIPFQIDDERVQVTYFDELLSLSSTEFRLLRILCKHPGRVYSRAQLMEIAWSEPEAAMERTVDAHIKSLRGKMRVVNDTHDAIETHRGMGYSLREKW
ncbi:MAG: two-component system response regulator CreB [Verrucomicrobiales bacterium]|nr:two-component system response regulator CreB [Verrucomicrobiales bacterium]